MLFNVLRIGDPTANGNRTVVLRYGENVTTDLGTIVNSRVARAVVEASSLKAKVGDNIELDMGSTFRFEVRPFTIPEGEENEGQILELTWIVVK